MNDNEYGDDKPSPWPLVYYGLVVVANVALVVLWLNGWRHM